MKPRSTRTASRGATAGLTAVEALLAAVLAAGLAVAALSAVAAASGTASAAAALASAQGDAERVAGLLAQEVRASGPGGPGGLVVEATGLQPGAPGDRVTYATCLGFDAGPPVTLRWSPRRSIAFEADGAEVLGNGKDDDGDLLVDEGRVVLRAAGAAQPTAVLGRDLARLELRLDLGPDGGRSTLSVAVTAERIIGGALVDGASVERARRGSGARATHVARATVPLLD